MIMQSCINTTTPRDFLLTTVVDEYPSPSQKPHTAWSYAPHRVVDCMIMLHETDPCDA